MTLQPPSLRAFIFWLLMVLLATGLAVRSLAATNQDFVGTIDFEHASTAGQITLQIQTSVPPVAEGWLFVTENGSGTVTSWTCPGGWAVTDSDTTKSSTHAPFVLCHKTMEDGDPGTNYVVYNNLTTGSILYGIAFATTPGSNLDTVGETWNASTTSPLNPGLTPSSPYDLLVSLIFTNGTATFATSPTPYPTPLQQNSGAYVLSAQPGTTAAVGPWTEVLSSAIGVTRVGGNLGISAGRLYHSDTDPCPACGNSDAASGNSHTRFATEHHNHGTDAAINSLNLNHLYAARFGSRRRWPTLHG